MLFALLLLRNYYILYKSYSKLLSDRFRWNFQLATRRPLKQDRNKMTKEINSTPRYQPLYKQVYDTLINRLSQGYWRAGDTLPSEFALADELGVSQGTVRKALNSLVSKNILRRQQGKGTYVTEHTAESALYRFFRYRETGGERLIPQTNVLSRRRRKAKKSERQRLGIDSQEFVSEMIRVRSFNGKPVIYEVVVQPLSIFPGLDKLKELPDSLYSFYQTEYGISIVEVQDELTAIDLPDKIASHLELPSGSAALMTDRLSINIDDRPVEWSLAYCNTKDFVYAVSLK